MKKTIGILAHVDAGKTTLSEQILFYTNSIRKKGRVDNKDSFLDSHNIEKERGITVFSGQAIFNIKDSTYYLVDTPGHVDFSPEMERAIAIMDYGILLINASDGVQGHTETLWNLLRKYNVPTIFFINKIDLEGADIEKSINDIKENFTKDILCIEEDLSKEELSLEEIETLCSYDDKLLEKYLLGEYNNKEFLDLLKKLIKENKIFPCFKGSALQNIKISEFLNSLEEITYTDYKDNGLSGVVYKIRHEENGNKIVFLKLLKGVLSVKDEVLMPSKEKEKINSIRIYNGNKFKTVDKVYAGDIFGVMGLNSLEIGDYIGEEKKKIKYNMVPTLATKIILKDKINVKDALKYFKILNEEDPSLNVFWNEALQEIQVHIMGKIQLEVLKEVALERFNLNIDFGECEILYKETIKNTVIGSGHFEPLKHYAEVRLLMEPLKRGEGIVFESKCHTDNLSYGLQNLVKTHVFEKEHKGILTNSPITDIKITLLTGRSHIKHTEGGDFREATYRAIRQGLEKAENILLEPYYKFKITAPLENMGRIISDIQKLSGEFNPVETTENKVIITGRGPVSTFMNYSMEITSFTKGRGNINFIFDGYDKCHNFEEVIEKIGYNKDSDIENTSTSVFCAKGSGYLVPWDLADDYMHTTIDNI